MLSRTAQLWRFASRSSTLPRTSSPILVNYRGKKSKAKAKSANAASLSKEASLGVDLSRFEENMRKTVETLNISYSRLRTDGATPGFLDGT